MNQFISSVIHNKYSGNKKDVYNMGEQALELAKPYFNPKTTYVSEGLVLDSSELERFDTSYRGLGLLKFKTEYNPEGLNPEKFGVSSFLTGAVINSIPGMIIQIVLIPVLVMILNKAEKSRINLHKFKIRNLCGRHKPSRRVYMPIWC